MFCAWRECLRRQFSIIKYSTNVNLDGNVDLTQIVLRVKGRLGTSGLDRHRVVVRVPLGSEPQTSKTRENKRVGQDEQEAVGGVWRLRREERLGKRGAGREVSGRDGAGRRRGSEAGKRVRVGRQVRGWRMGSGWAARNEAEMNPSFESAFIMNALSNLVLGPSAVVLQRRSFPHAWEIFGDAALGLVMARKIKYGRCGDWPAEERQSESTSGDERDSIVRGQQSRDARGWERTCDVRGRRGGDSRWTLDRREDGKTRGGLGRSTTAKNDVQPSTEWRTQSEGC
ncbi:hypothetical protein DFP72DRAFT_1039382 [Ephemerocybe angulata]|uniref:Uncharacterized protein n=1 Tax=Ephemerocybe angulata TaxID=980116 RepID=A0A8H6IH22_9AGAR|nr:hypothetical protein DFP72DRAFT_1039382 [Tulosesus angulatus]